MALIVWDWKIGILYSWSGNKVWYWRGWEGWNIAKGAIASSLYSVVVLDELNPVLDLGAAWYQGSSSYLQNRPDGEKLLLEEQPSSLVRISQLHSEMRPRSIRDASQLKEKGLMVELNYTGEGKGKSTSALGKALQAIGKGISQDKSHRV